MALRCLIKMTNKEKITKLVDTIDSAVAHLEFMAKQVATEHDYRDIMGMVESMEKTLSEVRGD